MQLDTLNQLSRTTIALHWIIAMAMIGLLTVGVYMTETETYSLYDWHKSFGFLIFFVVIFRVAWRIKNGWPVPVGQPIKIERNLAKAVHWILIIGTVLMPISGFLMSSLWGHGVNVLGVEVVARNPAPENPSQVVAHNENLASFFHRFHHWLGYILIGALVLHITGGLKHHIIDKDGTLKRMLGYRI